MVGAKYVNVQASRTIDELVALDAKAQEASARVTNPNVKAALDAVVKKGAEAVVAGTSRT